MDKIVSYKDDYRDDWSGSCDNHHWDEDKHPTPMWRKLWYDLDESKRGIREIEDILKYGLAEIKDEVYDENYWPKRDKKPYHIDSCNITFKCSDPDLWEECEEDECMKNTKKPCDSIMNAQVKISRCEARLFCEVARHLGYEVCRARNLTELSKVIDMIYSFLLASARKEKSIAEIVNSCKPENEHIDKCDDCC